MSDITPADALRELGDDQAEYAAAAAKKLRLPESVAAIRARRWDSPDALALGDLASARIAGQDITVLLEALGRIEALIDAAEKRSPIGAAYDRAHPDETAAVLIPVRDLRAALDPVVSEESP